MAENDQCYSVVRVVLIVLLTLTAFSNVAMLLGGGGKEDGDQLGAHVLTFALCVLGLIGLVKQHYGITVGFAITIAIVFTFAILATFNLALMLVAIPAVWSSFYVANKMKEMQLDQSAVQGPPHFVLIAPY
ncbi:hypothetical protein HDE_07731 [Halotydeus destructor]|nr:hypothetical protein HDE_07731 [Halotydeus destructor]